MWKPLEKPEKAATPRLGSAPTRREVQVNKPFNVVNCSSSSRGVGAQAARLPGVQRGGPPVILHDRFLSTCDTQHDQELSHRVIGRPVVPCLPHVLHRERQFSSLIRSLAKSRVTSADQLTDLVDQLEGRWGPQCCVQGFLESSLLEELRCSSPLLWELNCIDVGQP